MALLGGLLIFIGLLGLILGIVTLIKPVGRLRIPTRRVAGAVLAASFVVMIFGGILTPSKNDPPAKAEAAATSAPGAKPTAEPTATDTPRATNTLAAEPASTNTPKPTAEPTNTPVPLTFEQQVAKSYKDNKGFMVRAVSGPTVRWISESGILELRKYENSNGAGDTLTVVAHSALVANKAIWTTYPEVKLLQFTLVEDFTNLNTGAKSQEVSAAIMIDRATAAKFDYNGLKNVILGDNKRFFCTAPHAFINFIVFREIKDKGCIGLPGKDPAIMLLDVP